MPLTGQFRTSEVTRICGHTFLGNHLSHDSIVWDIGANKGTFAKEVVARYGCQVHAVEVTPELIDVLRRLDPAYVAVHPVAIGPRIGTGKFELSANSEASHLVDDESVSPSAVFVPVITLEKLLTCDDNSQIDLLKLDIEGTELDVLASVPESTLLRIRQLTVEFHQFLDPSSKAAIVAVKRRIRSIGFRDLDFSTVNNDVLFVHPSLDYSLRTRCQLQLDRLRLGISQKARNLVRRQRQP